MIPFLDQNPNLSAAYLGDDGIKDACREFAEEIASHEKNKGVPREERGPLNPLAAWLEESEGNFDWAVCCWRQCLREHRLRFGESSGFDDSERDLYESGYRQPESANKLWLSCSVGFVEEIKTKRVVYFHSQEFISWTNRPKPFWIKEKEMLFSGIKKRHNQTHPGRPKTQNLNNPNPKEQKVKNTPSKAPDATSDKDAAAAEKATEAKQAAPKTRSPFSPTKLLKCKLTLGGENYRREGTKGHNTIKILAENPGILGSDLVAKGGRIADVVWDLKNENERAKITVEHFVEDKEEA